MSNWKVVLDRDEYAVFRRTDRQTLLRSQFDVQVGDEVSVYVRGSENRLHQLGADVDVADAAKILSRDPNIEIGRNRLFEFMHDQDWIFRGRHNCWKAYQDQVDLGRLKHRPGTEYFDRDRGEYRVGDPTILITAKGLAELQRLLGGKNLTLVATS